QAVIIELPQIEFERRVVIGCIAPPRRKPQPAMEDVRMGIDRLVLRRHLAKGPCSRSRRRHPKHCARGKTPTCDCTLRPIHVHPQSVVIYPRATAGWLPKPLPRVSGSSRTASSTSE